MYWPHGVPRIYAVNGSGNRLPAESSGHEESEAVPSEDDKFSRKEEKLVDNDFGKERSDSSIIGLQVSRNGHLFATMTKSSLSIWQTRPTAVLAAYTRSPSSLETYGSNVALLLRPDSVIVVVHTANGYLITYSIATDPNARVYQQRYDQTQSRRHSLARLFSGDEEYGLREVNIRFRMVIKVDAGISKALALDNELIVATAKPAAIQCIRWTPDSKGSQTSTELMSRIQWISKKTTVIEMVHDRAMSLSVWITSDGNAYAVQRETEESNDAETPKRLFRGFCFHAPEQEDQYAVKAVVNARFSLLAVSCVNGEVWVYTAKDYVGNIPLSHKHQMPVSYKLSGSITFLNYSPDGYCLFAGCEKGWMTWSVFGKPGGSSFNSDHATANENKESWLNGISDGSWLAGGSEVLLAAQNDERLWILETARSAGTGCLSSANLARALLQTSTEIIIYRGHDLPDLTTISGETSLWHHAPFPPAYLHNQWPIRSCSISQDGRYVAIAGRRGLAHYSVQSGRWRTFDDFSTENSFAVRGGMCWYGHFLIAATESDDSYELRVYSRELSLDKQNMLHFESLPSPAVLIGPSGEDSLLVYTYENVLYHYVINVSSNRVSLVQVGQITFHGIVRAPARVRAVSWVLPDTQLRNGDPSQDVAVASVLFLVDDKLVLLQPSRTEEGDLKYDMRVIGHHIEYYILMRDQLSFNFAPPLDESAPTSPAADTALNGYNLNHSLRDSLWTFSGNDLQVWNDVQEMLRITCEGPLVEVSPPLPIPVDFYPLSILLNKGVILGVESEMLQRRGVTFAIFRFAIRTHLFIPYLLRHHLSQLDTPAALALSRHYKYLSYFPHALEILLHNVLDDEVDSGSDNKIQTNHSPNDLAAPTSLLPVVLAFLQSSFPISIYLDIIVQCTRKTELRSWRTLFAHLPPPKELFEQALKIDSLKTAAGYLLVLHAFDEKEGAEERIGEYVVRLLRLGTEKGDWELCGELARFLVALDESGDMLREAVVKIGLREGNEMQRGKASSEEGIGLGLSMPKSLPSRPKGGDAEGCDASPVDASSGRDYFSASPGHY